MTVFTFETVNNNIKCKMKFADNHSHKIMRVFDVLPNFSFNTSETKPDYWQ